MRVFVTGATGFVGTAVVNELLMAGHEVLGLARNDANAEALAKAGAKTHKGELTDTDSLVAGAKACDGVIHTAFIHDFSKFAENVEVDRRAVEAMAAALEGSGKPFVVTSGTALLSFHAPGQLATEEGSPPPETFRAASEAIVMAASGRGVRGSVVRLSPSTHGAGDHGFVPIMIGMARAKGFAAYIGEGANRWPAVHRLDAARLYRLALEKAAPGSRFHAAAEEGVPMREIAQTIGAGLGLPVRSLTGDEVPAYFDWFARFAAIDNLTSSAITRKALGWRPEGPELLADMTANYFG
jgi:nucleoside-diphosphate-sugar epimerase